MFSRVDKDNLWSQRKRFLLFRNMVRHLNTCSTLAAVGLVQATAKFVQILTPGHEERNCNVLSV